MVFGIIPLYLFAGMANYWTSNQDLEAHNMEVKACMNLLDGGEENGMMTSTCVT